MLAEIQVCGKKGSLMKGKILGINPAKESGALAKV